MDKIFNLDQYNSLILENKISLNRSSLSDDLKSFVSSDVPEPSFKNSGEKKQVNEISESLSKTLRKKWKMQIESDDFHRSTDGHLKSSYNDDFLKAWKKAADDGEPGEDKFFFYDGGIYDITDSKTSLKSPKNFKKWSAVRGVDSMNEEDGVDFMRNYMTSFKNFGGVDTNSMHKNSQRLMEAIDSMANGLNENEDSPVFTAYDGVLKVSKNQEVPFVDYDTLKGPVMKSIKKIVNECMKNDDYQSRDVAFMNNAICLLAPCVTYDGENYISAYKYILDKVVTPEVLENSNLYILKENTNDPLIYFTADNMMDIFHPSTPDSKPENIFDLKRIEGSLPSMKRIHPSLHFLHGVDPEVYSGPVKTQDGGKFKTRTSNVFLRNLINSSRVLNKVNTHCKRMNCIEAEDIPQKVAGNRCIVIDTL
jgi:hypothetical protein